MTTPRDSPASTPRNTRADMNALSAPHSKGEDQFLDKKNIAEEGAAGGDSGSRERGGDTTWILQREAGGSDVRVKCSGEGAFTITVLRDEEGGANGLNPSAGSEGGCVDSDGEGEFLWDVQACGSGSDSRQLRQGTQNTCSQASMDATVQRSTEEDKVDGSSDNGRVEQGALPAQKLHAIHAQEGDEEDDESGSWYTAQSSMTPEPLGAMTLI